MDISSINAIHNGYKNREYSVSDVVDETLARIKKFDTKVNAYITLTEEYARRRAADLDLQMAHDIDVLRRYPLFGVPAGLKDIFMTRGVKTTAASKVLEDYIPQYSATSWTRLEHAGAILMGKLNCDAWAHGSSGENSDFGDTKNPWNLEHVPGGSSSGSGAALAAELATFTMGTDTGGSVRLPASFCGVVGLKPTYGRVSRYGVASMASSLDTIGHFSKTVEDAARILAVSAGKDTYDATTAVEDVYSYHEHLDEMPKTIRIGLPEEFFSEAVRPEVLEVIKNAISVFETELTFEFKSVSLPHTKYGIAAYYIIQPSEVSSNLGRYDGIRYGNGRETFGAEAKRRIMLGTYTLSAGYYDAYYKQAMKVRTLLRQDYDAVFEEVDVLLAPVSPTPAFKLGEKTNDPLEMYLADSLTVTTNLAGNPGLAVPCGFTDGGLPIGFQLIGPHFSEQLLFQVGHAYQKHTDWHLKRPALIT